jgi:hypothetical protein
MTAVDKYQRLECDGLWRAAASAQLREVVVGLRDATLVLADPRSGMALTHWSLPAVERINPGELPALFTAGRLDDGEPAETLEVSDPYMIAALDMVRVTLVRRRPRPGRLRGVMVFAILTTVLCFSVLWLPGAMIRHTASVLPPATRVLIGKMALQDMARVTGSPCGTPLGRRASAALALRLSSLGVVEIVVVRDGVDTALGLPGGLIVLSRKLVEMTEDPEVLAGYVVAETLRTELRDPMIPILGHAGLMATFGLLTTGELSAGSLALLAESLLKITPAPLDHERLLDRFRKVNLSSAAYARAIDPSGETTLALIEADPFKGQSPASILDDNDWVSLQGICDG